VASDARRWRRIIRGGAPGTEPGRAFFFSKRSSKSSQLSIISAVISVDFSMKYVIVLIHFSLSFAESHESNIDTLFRSDISRKAC
jgi:hypothetical protein